MSMQLAVVATDSQTEKQIYDELRRFLQGQEDCQVVHGIETAANAQLVFVHAPPQQREELLAGIDRKGKALILILSETDIESEELEDSRVDDVLVRPFRKMEVHSKLRHYQQILMWDEVARLNTSFSEVLERLKDDLQLAERLQKARLPVRFDDIRGFKISQRYLAGMRSGGDHFDLAESRDGNILSLVLSDSSSYGLCSAVLSVLMRATVKLSADEVRSTAETVRRIQEELRLVLGEKDQLSLFYAVLSRKDYVLKYLNRGNATIYYAAPGSQFKPLPSQGAPFSRFSDPVLGGEQEVTLEPQGRLAILSDGFLELAGGASGVLRILDERRTKEAVDTLNELVFQVKSKLSDPEDMPAQDCTAAIFDVDSKVIRIAR